MGGRRRDGGSRRRAVRVSVLLQLRHGTPRAPGRSPLHRPGRQHRDRRAAEGTRRPGPRSRTFDRPRRRARPGHGQHPGTGRNRPARHHRLGAPLGGGTPPAPQTAAQLPDRVFARGHARLLRDARRDPEGRQTHDRRGALADRVPRLPRPHRTTGGLSHRWRDLHPACPVRRTGPVARVQDAAVSGPRAHHACDPRPGSPRRQRCRAPGGAGQPAPFFHRAGHAPAHERRRGRHGARARGGGG